MPTLEEILPIVLVLVIFFILFRLLDFIKPDSRKEKVKDPLDSDRFEQVSCIPDTPVPFGYKICWLAIRSGDPEKIVIPLDVVQSLGMDVVQFANWASGIDFAYQEYVFVTPPVNGWVFVVGNSLPEPEVEPEEKKCRWSEFMSGLAEQFHEVQYFGTHRVVDYTCWAKYVNGKEIRAYAYSGSDGITLLDRGEPTPEEKELGFNFFDERCPEAEEDSYWEREDLRYPDEEDVMQISGKWSLNPQELANISQEKGCGDIGFLKGT